MALEEVGGDSPVFCKGWWANGKWHVLPTRIAIYIYMYVCICVCVYTQKLCSSPAQKRDFSKLNACYHKHKDGCSRVFLLGQFLTPHAYIYIYDISPARRAQDLPGNTTLEKMSQLNEQIFILRSLKFDVFSTIINILCRFYSSHEIR